MAEIFQKAIEDLTREEAQDEVRRAWEEWRHVDDLCDQARDWAIAANSLRVTALEALREYGYHRRDCPEWDKQRQGCNCGFRAAIEGEER